MIGNSGYRSLPVVPSASLEAAAVATALRDLKFEVEVILDATIDEMRSSIGAFVESLQSGDIAIIYFSGHALQYYSQNYYLPIDFPGNSVERPDQFSAAYSVSLVEAQLAEKKVALRIQILEACRQNPAIGRHFPLPGLAAVDLTVEGAIVAVSAAVSSLAQPPPNGQIGVFTSAVTAALGATGLTVDEAFKRAQKQVAESGPDARLPALYTTVLRRIYLAGEPPKPPPEQVIVVKPAALPPLAAGSLLTKPTPDRQDYVWIPRGKFQMGCVPDDRECSPEEKPRHEVTLSQGFWIGKTETTVVAYRTFIEKHKIDKSVSKRFGKITGGRMPKASDIDKKWRMTDHPMIQVTLEESAAFCNWVGGRLPTEAEWEYAARSGLDGAKYPTGNEMDREKANYQGKKGADLWEGTAPVRRFEPNKWQVFDMAGNVWEWVSDWYATATYEAATQCDPTGPATGLKRIRRGGSWNSGPKEMRISARSLTVSGHYNNTGFRCVIPPE